MKYIIMCGGQYDKWDTPRQLLPFKGEPLVMRTIRLLKEAGVEDIAVSSNNIMLALAGAPVLPHTNSFKVGKDGKVEGYWVDAFYPTEEPVCYLYGDVVYSPEAIKTIVETETDDIEFFASSYPFDKKYIKKWAEPFAFKVQNTERFQQSIRKTKLLCSQGKFRRHPISWELWQVIKDTELNKIDYTNYTVINDYTCDVDDLKDLQLIEDKV